MTAKRRAERKQFKQDRADAISAAQAEAEAVYDATGVLPPILSELAFIPSHSRPTRPNQASTTLSPHPPPEPSLPAPPIQPALGVTVEEDGSEFEQMEHLQLTLQEAFFLSWSLGCLRILDPETVRRFLSMNPPNLNLTHTTHGCHGARLAGHVPRASRPPTQNPPRLSAFRFVTGRRI